MLAQLRVHATRGSAPSAALGRLEDGAPASRDRLRSFVVSLRGGEDAGFRMVWDNGTRRFPIGGGRIDGGMLVQLRVHATRGSAPSAALGRLEDGAPASRDRLRCSFVAQGLLPRKLPRHTNPLRELMTFVMGRS